MPNSWNFRALGGPGVRAPGPWKSNGAPVKFCLRAQWTPQIGELVMYFNGGTLQILLGALGNSNCGAPDPQQKCLPRALELTVAFLSNKKKSNIREALSFVCCEFCVHILPTQLIFLRVQRHVTCNLPLLLLWYMRYCGILEYWGLTRVSPSVNSGRQ